MLSKLYTFLIDSDPKCEPYLSSIQRYSFWELNQSVTIPSELYWLKWLLTDNVYNLAPQLRGSYLPLVFIPRAGTQIAAVWPRCGTDPAWAWSLSETAHLWSHHKGDSHTQSCWTLDTFISPWCLPGTLSQSLSSSHRELHNNFCRQIKRRIVDLNVVLIKPLIMQSKVMKAIIKLSLTESGNLCCNGGPHGQDQCVVSECGSVTRRYHMGSDRTI